MKAIFRLLQEIKPHRFKVIIILVTGILMSAASAQFAILLKQLMDSLEHPNPKTLYQVGGLIILVALLQASFRYVHLFLTDITIERLIQSLRQQLQAKLLALSPQYYLSQPQGSGGILSRMLNDMLILQNGFRYTVDLIREPVLLVLLMGWLFYLNWELTLSILIVLPILLLLLKQLSRSIAKYSRLGQEQMERVTQFIKENLDGIRVIQSFTLESYAKKRLGKIFDTYYQIRKTMHARVQIGGPVGELVAMVVGVLVVISIASRIQTGQATYGDFTSYLAALIMLNRPIKVIQEAVVRIQEVRVAAERLFQTLDEKILILDPPNPKPFPKDFDGIHFKNIHFQYGDRPILKNINLHISKGQSVALVGASGSGKSTFINLLPRFFEPQSGQILIDQVPIADISIQELRKNIAMVTQEVFLFSNSIAENIHTGDLDNSPEHITTAAKEASAYDFIMQQPQGFDTQVGERGHFFSGGEKQRISIARAIFKDAPILIFDEATSNLDAVNESLIQEAMKTFTLGKTCLIVAHRLASITHCDQIWVFEEGQCVEQGTHQELLTKKGVYYRLALNQGLIH